MEDDQLLISDMTAVLIEIQRAGRAFNGAG
jgi:hypothetical protein